MCGIAGVLDYDGGLPLKPVIHSMVEQILHRGPDGNGCFIRDNIALGHARLSIIDIAGGAQPMSSSDGMIHLTYNGEIYNYVSLRKTLKQKGHTFKTESDTEVILNAYRQWGKRCVEHLEGMYAFAVADFIKREVFLARDPFGIKPLLYRVQHGSFVFASEFQAFRVLPDWENEIDLVSIDMYLRYQYIPAPKTVFRKVFKLPAGHCMTVRMGESYQKIERYWQPDFSKKQRIREHDRIDQLDEALRDSVRRHLVSDVPFGALLSGGVDSSLVVGYMAEILDRPVKTFSIGFEDERVDELKYARIVAQKYGTEHHEDIVRFDALDILPQIVKHHGEPFGDQSAIPTWYVSQLARQEVPMVLSGDGGDELFAGYGTYGNWLRKMNYYRPATDESWKRVLRPFANGLFPARYPAIKQPEDDPQYWTDCIIRFNASQRESLWRPEFRFLSDQSSLSFDKAFELGGSAFDVNRVQLADMETFLPEDILCKVDISSMRHGLEVRPPMLDRKFFEICRSIPYSDLYKAETVGKTYSGKLPLKDLLAQKINHDFAYRPKQGFEVPLQKWITSKEGRQGICDQLLGSGTKISQWFAPEAIQENIDQGHFVNVWLLAVLEEWLNQNTEGKKAVH